MTIDGKEVEVPTLLLEKGKYSLVQWLKKGQKNKLKNLIVQQAAEGLEFINGCGIVHLDYKPGNLVMFSDEHH